MIYVNNIRITDIFNMKNVAYYFRTLVLMVITIALIGFYIVSSLYGKVLSDHERRLGNIINTEGIDLTLMCNVVSCDKLTAKINGEFKAFKNINGVLKDTDNFPTEKRMFVFSDITKDGYSIVKVDGTTFYIDDKKYFIFVHIILGMTIAIIVVIFSLAAIARAYYKAKTDYVEKSNYRAELSSRLQRDLTESLHHEMGMPLALIETLVREFFALIYPCKYTEDNVCDFQNDVVDAALCQDCEFFKRRRATDHVAVDYYTKIRFAIDRINSVLTNIAAAKHIKYSNGTVSILSMMENIIAGFNNYKVNKLSAIYINKELLLRYAVSGGLNNGDMLNILGMMVKNSIEAKATEITFTGEQLVSGKINIYVKDNGRGIRDAMDRVIEDTMIFQYGFSTKDAHGNHVVAKTCLEKILLRMGINVISHGTPRGVGLSVNKNILLKCGGDIVIHETSSSGTTFKITLPIKERRCETTN